MSEVQPQIIIPKVVAEIGLALSDDGRLQAQIQGDNKLVLLGMLEMAKVQILSGGGGISVPRLVH